MAYEEDIEIPTDVVGGYLRWLLSNHNAELEFPERGGRMLEAAFNVSGFGGVIDLEVSVYDRETGTSGLRSFHLELS
jgi:hypothetical protein